MAVQPTSIHTSLEKVVEAIGDIKNDPWSKFSAAAQHQGLSDTLFSLNSPGDEAQKKQVVDELQKLIKQEAQRRKDQQTHSGTSGFWDRRKADDSNRFKSIREAQEQAKLARENQQFQQRNIIPPTVFREVAFELGMLVPRSQEEHYSLLPKTFQPSELEPRSVLHSMLGLIGGYSWSPLRKRYRAVKNVTGPENLALLFDSFSLAVLRCHVVRQRAINAGLNEGAILQSVALMDTLKNQINEQVEHLRKTMSKEQIAELAMDRVTFRETMDAFLFEHSIGDLMTNDGDDHSTRKLKNNDNNNSDSNSIRNISNSNQQPASSFLLLRSKQFRATNNNNNNNINVRDPDALRNNSTLYHDDVDVLGPDVSATLLFRQSSNFCDRNVNRKTLHEQQQVTSSSSPNSPLQMSLGRSAVGSNLTKLQKKMDTSVDEPTLPFELMDPVSRIDAYDAVFDAIDIRRAGAINWNSLFAAITQASLLPKLGGLVHHPRIVEFSHWILPSKMREIFGNVHHVATFSKGDAQIICSSDAACVMLMPRQHQVVGGSDEEKCDEFFASLKYIVTFDAVRCFVNGQSVSTKNRPVETFAEKLRRQKRDEKDEQKRRERRLQNGELSDGDEAANDNGDDDGAGGRSQRDCGGVSRKRQQRSKREDENLLHGDRLTALSLPKKTREPPPQVVQVLVVDRVSTIVVSSTDGTVKFFHIAGSQSLPHCELFFTVYCDNTVSAICPAWNYSTLYFGTRQGHVLAIDFPLPQKNLSSKSLRIHCMNAPSRRRDEGGSGSGGSAGNGNNNSNNSNGNDNKNNNNSNARSRTPPPPRSTFALLSLRPRKHPANSSKVPETPFHCYIKKTGDDEQAKEKAFRAVEVFDVTFKAQALPHRGIVSYILHLEVEKAVLSCSYDHSLMLSHETTLEPLVQYTGHTSGVHKAIHSDDYNFICSMAFDSRPLVWSVSTTPSRKPPMELYDPASPHQGTVVDCDYIPSSNIVITMDDVGVVKFWDMRLIHCFDSVTVAKHQPSIMGTFSADSGSNVNEKFRDDMDLAKITSMPLRFVGMSIMYEPSSLTSPTETLRITAFTQYHGAAVCEWNLRLKERVVKNAADDQPIVASFALNDDAAYQIVGNVTSEHYRTWDIPSGHIRDFFTNENHLPAGGICVACINKPKTVVAVGTRDGSIFVHNANTNSLIQGFRHVFGHQVEQKSAAGNNNNIKTRHKSATLPLPSSSSSQQNNLNPVSQICCFAHAPQFHLKRNAPRIMVMSLCLSLNQLHLVNLDPSNEGGIVDDAYLLATRQSSNAKSQNAKYGKGAQLSAALATAALEKGVYLELLDEFEPSDDDECGGGDADNDDGEKNGSKMCGNYEVVEHDSFHQQQAKEQQQRQETLGAFSVDFVADNNVYHYDEAADRSWHTLQNPRTAPTTSGLRKQLGQSERNSFDHSKTISVAKQYAKSGIAHSIRCFDVDQSVDLVLVGTSHAKIVGFALSSVCATAALRIPIGILLLPPPRKTAKDFERERRDDDTKKEDEEDGGAHGERRHHPASAAGEEDISKKISTGDLDPIIVKVLDRINCGVAVTESGRICLFSIGCPFRNKQQQQQQRQEHNSSGSIWGVGSVDNYSAAAVDLSFTDGSPWSLTHVNNCDNDSNIHIPSLMTTTSAKSNAKRKKCKQKLPNHFSPLACWHHTNESQFSATQSPLPTIVESPGRLPHILYVGDDKGFVTIYDLLPIITDGADVPRVINRWLAHNFEPVSSILFLPTKDRPETVCCTSGGDQSFHSFSMSGSLYFGSLDLHQRLSILSVPHFLSDDLDTFDHDGEHVERLKNAPGAQLVMCKKDIFEFANRLVEKEARARAVLNLTQEAEEEISHQPQQQQKQHQQQKSSQHDHRVDFAELQHENNVHPSFGTMMKEEGVVNDNDDGGGTDSVADDDDDSNDSLDDGNEDEDDDQQQQQLRSENSAKTIVDHVFDVKVAKLNQVISESNSSKVNKKRHRSRKDATNNKKTNNHDRSRYLRGDSTPTAARAAADSEDTTNQLFASGVYASFGSASPITRKIDPRANPYENEVWKEGAVRLVMEGLRRTLLVPRCRWVTPLKSVFWSKVAYDENTDDVMQIVQSLRLAKDGAQAVSTINNKNFTHNNNDFVNKATAGEKVFFDLDHEEDIHHDLELFGDFLGRNISGNHKEQGVPCATNESFSGESIAGANYSFAATTAMTATESARTPTFEESLLLLRQQTHREREDVVNTSATAAAMVVAVPFSKEHERLLLVTRRPPQHQQQQQQQHHQQEDDLCQTRQHQRLPQQQEAVAGEAARTGGGGLFYKAAPNLSKRPPTAGGAKKKSVLDYAETRWGDAATSRYLHVVVKQDESITNSNNNVNNNSHQNCNNNNNNNNYIGSNNDRNNSSGIIVGQNNVPATLFEEADEESRILHPSAVIVQVPNLAVNTPLKYDIVVSESPSSTTMFQKKETPRKQQQLSSAARRQSCSTASFVTHRGIISSPSALVTSGRRTNQMVFHSTEAFVANGKTSLGQVQEEDRSELHCVSSKPVSFFGRSGHVEQQQDRQLGSSSPSPNNNDSRNNNNNNINSNNRAASTPQPCKEAALELKRAQATRHIFAALANSPIYKKERDDEDCKLFGEDTKKVVKGVVIHKKAKKPNSAPSALLMLGNDNGDDDRDDDDEDISRIDNAQKTDIDGKVEDEAHPHFHSPSSTISTTISLRPESRALLSKFSKIRSVTKLRNTLQNRHERTSQRPPLPSSISASSPSRQLPHDHSHRDQKSTMMMQQTGIVRGFIASRTSSVSVASMERR